jgi:uncharacterized protein (DUF4415 family)
MKTYNFSKGKRGPVRPPRPEPAGKVRITIRLDEDIVDHFTKEADRSKGKVGYQSLINEALRNSITGPKLEEIIRKAVRKELRRGVA